MPGFCTEHHHTASSSYNFITMKYLIILNTSHSPSSSARTTQQDWCPYVLLLQGVLLIWAIRQLFLIFWKYCTHNGYIESVVPGPWVWPIFGHIPTAVPIRPAGLKRFHEWTKRFPVMVKYVNLAISSYYRRVKLTIS